MRECPEGDGMKRKLFTILAAVSLLLCVATIALWMRGRSSLWFGQIDVQVASIDGKVVLLHPGVGGMKSSLLEYHYEEPVPKNRLLAQPSVARWIEWAELTHNNPPRFELDAGAGGFAVVVPHIGLVAAFAIAPGLLVLRSARRRRNTRLGRCAKCNYDLRATPERCPECGRVAEIPQGKYL
jgi:hypothetical protein